MTPPGKLLDYRIWIMGSVSAFTKKGNLPVLDLIWGMDLSDPSRVGQQSLVSRGNGYLCLPLRAFLAHHSGNARTRDRPGVLGRLRIGVGRGRRTAGHSEVWSVSAPARSRFVRRRVDVTNADSQEFTLAVGFRFVASL